MEPVKSETFDDLAIRLMGDRFSIERDIGAGAFGRVVEARDLVLDRRVAIKVIPLRGARPKETKALLHEARAAASAGPSAVAVYDVLSASGGVAIVMELVQSGSLIVAARTGIARGRGIALALAVAESVAAIHEHGILHLDLHPGNLLLRDDDTVVATDFGLAQFAKSIGLSRGGHEKNWTAPELIGYGLASTQADVYALGLVVAWIGRRSGVAFEPVVTRSTSTDPRDRQTDACGFLADLRELVALDLGRVRR